MEEGLNKLEGEMAEKKREKKERRTRGEKDVAEGMLYVREKSASKYLESLKNPVKIAQRREQQREQQRDAVGEGLKRIRSGTPGCVH